MFHGFIFSNVFVAPEIAADTGILASKSLKIIGTLGKHALQKLGQQMRFCNTEEPFPKFRVAIIPTCFFFRRDLCLHMFTLRIFGVFRPYTACGKNDISGSQFPF